MAGETNDSHLNDIRGRHVSKTDVLDAIVSARSGKVLLGNIGAGTVTFGFKGGIGTSSRKLPDNLGGHTAGVLQVTGVPVGKALNKYYYSDTLNETPDGSYMIIVAADAPLDARNLKRLAKRAMLGLVQTGGIASNGSDDYVIAFSTDAALR